MTVIPGSQPAFFDLPGRRAADPLDGVAARSSLRIVEMERTAGRTAHRHPHSEEIVYVAAGKGHVWIDGESSPVQTGDFVHVPIGAAHATIPAEGVTMRLICFFPHSDLDSNIEGTDFTVT